MNLILIVQCLLLVGQVFLPDFSLQAVDFLIEDSFDFLQFQMMLDISLGDVFLATRLDGCHFVFKLDMNFTQSCFKTVCVVSLYLVYEAENTVVTLK